MVVKNNAYNAGLEQTVKHCSANGMKRFALTTLEEALIIKQVDKNVYVLVMNPMNREEISLAKQNDIALSIVSKEWYDTFEEDLTGVRLHLKVNVGMNRFGLNDIEQINELVNKNANIEGLFTHFPVAEEEDLTLHNHQVARFKEVYEAIENKANLKYIHSENSATLMLDDSRLSFCNYARIGIIAYGYSPTTFDDNLKSSFYLTSEIMFINEVGSGQQIGYGFKNKVVNDILVGFCPLGYGDGLSKLRELLPVIINDKKYRIIAISMSHMLIEIDEKVKLHDQVEVYGDHIKIDHLLDVCTTSCSVHMTSLK